jgi:alkylhydroperoxidase family enzyme
VENPTGRYAAFTQRIMDVVLAGPGHTPSELRRAVLGRAARLAGARAGAPAPAPFAAYVDKVAQHAYKVTDADVAALQKAGNSDDVLFEVTVSAAVGAALGRLERGLAALRGEEPD